MKKGNLQSRRAGVLITFILGGIILLVNIFKLQLFTPAYKKLAEKNVVRKESIHSVRGSIYDRNGKLLVGNQRSYDLMVIPKNVKNLDTVALAEYTDTPLEYLRYKLKRAKRYSRILPSALVKNIEKESGMRLLERIHQFPGIYLEERTARHYPIPIAANVLGYIGRVSPTVISKKPFYDRNDNIGITGVEKTYEDTLRGEKGYRYINKDVHSREKGSYEDGKNDLASIPGKDLTLTLDADLQLYAEQLMQNKKGAIVAIEPSSGEILTLVSSPTYDPNLLIGRRRSKNYSILEKDTLTPLYDRSLVGLYPPGSTFKLVNALIGLQEGVISTSTAFPCNHGWRFSPKLKVGCHAHRSPLNLKQSIAQSCNAYYCYTFQRLIDKNNNTRVNYEKWTEYVESFGLGNYLNNDLHTGKRGLVPDTKFYDARYPFSWKAPTVISLSIGQDALLVTPIQMANMCAAIANRGHFYTPHILAEVNNKPIQIENFTTPKKINIDKRHFETVINGMQEVVEGKKGTATNAKIDGIEICGKTGTAENFTRDKDGKRIQLKDHSIFIAFAPKDDPKIALAVYVENAGWGSSYGSPIASLLIEKYINGEITRPKLEEKIIEANLLDDRLEDETH